MALLRQQWRVTMARLMFAVLFVLANKTNQQPWRMFM